MASQKPVANMLADQFARVQERGKKDARGEDSHRRTRSSGAVDVVVVTSDEDDVFQSLAGAAVDAAAFHFGHGGRLLRTPPPAAAAGGAIPKVRARRDAAEEESPPPLPPRRRIESSPASAYRRNPIPDKQRNLLPLLPILKRTQSRNSSRASSTSSARRTPSPVGGAAAATEEVSGGEGNEESAAATSSPPRIPTPPPQPPIQVVAQQQVQVLAPQPAQAVAPPVPQIVVAAAPPAPPPAAIGHVVPAGGGLGAAMAPPVPPAVPGVAAAGRRAVIRAQRAINRAVDQLATAVNDEEPLEVVKTRETAVVRARATFAKLMDELTTAVDDPAVIAAEADREALLTQLEAYHASVDKPAEDSIADARQYVNEAEAAQKAKKNTKLPELTVMSFDGKVTEWPRFNAELESIIGSRADLPESSKLAYLVGACKGEAQRMVKQFRATNTPFATVMASLQARFGRPDLQLKQAFEAISKLDAGQHSASNTRKVLDELKPLLVTIRANGVDPDEPALTAMLLTQLGPKMRGEVMTAWHRHCTTQGWVGANLPRMEDFLTFVDREVDALLSGQASRSGATGNQRRIQPQQRQQLTQRAAGTALVGASDDSGSTGGGGKKTRRGKRGSGKGGEGAAGGSNGGAEQGGTALAAAKGAGAKAGAGGGGASGGKKIPACAFCRTDNHKPENCPDGKKLTPRERHRYLHQGCWRCLELGHMTRECKKQKKPCGVAGCEADHHRILHGDYEKPT
jgi:hypothetical protein